jgi:hypothetical protein
MDLEKVALPGIQGFIAIGYLHPLTTIIGKFFSTLDAMVLMVGRFLTFNMDLKPGT